MANGDDSLTEAAKHGAKYRAILKNMHKDNTAIKTQKPVNKLKLRKQW